MRALLEGVVIVLALIWFGWQAAVVLFLVLWLLNLATARAR